MTGSQIARMLHGKRAGKGWQCKCPNAILHAHGDRSRSLSVREIDGWVRFKCFAGCSREDILGAMGLSVRDLALNALPDRDAIRLAEKMRAEAERNRRESRRREREAIDRARKWEACLNALGKLLMWAPGDDKLALLFHHACNMSRNLPPTGFCDPPHFQPGDVFPHFHPLDGITAQDVGAQVAAYLHLEEPNE